MSVPTTRCDATIRPNTFVIRTSPGFDCVRSYADVVPGEWTKLKIEVHGDKARLYVQRAPQPALVVNDLKQAQGKIALWVGTETIAHFANLRVSR